MAEPSAASQPLPMAGTEVSLPDQGPIGAQERLSLSTLSNLPTHVGGPAYDPAAVTPGILHMGAGNFSLAHLGSYIHDILRIDPTWGIIAASIRSHGIISSLRKQDNLYVLIGRQGKERKATVMAPIVGALFGPESPKSIIETIADPRIRVITFTVSNKGYYLVGREGLLDVDHGDVRHDLALAPFDTPKTIYWYLTNGLEQRRTSCGKPLTLISLDNIPQNSKSLKKGLMQFVQERGLNDLTSWIEDNVDFPVSTVDRITPETTADFRKEAAQFLGFESTVVVGTEMFRQLVVERGRFATPPWDAAGAQIVDDCAPYWELKFFCLNGAHQVVAIPGQRLGIRYIWEAAQNPRIAALVERVHAEYATVMPSDAATVATYAQSIRSRFADSALADTVERVGARATSKVSERLLVAVERSLSAHGKVLSVPVFITACWLLNLGSEDEFGQSIALNDPDAPQLEDLHEELVNWLGAVDANDTETQNETRAALAMLVRRIGEAVKDNRFVRLSANAAFIEELSWAVVTIHKLGVEQAIDALLARSNV